MTDAGATEERAEGSRARPMVVHRSGAAYVPGDVIVRGAPALARLAELVRDERLRRRITEELRDDLGWHRVEGVPRELALVEVLRAEGYVAQVNHLLFAHPCGDPCPPHPAVAFSAAGLGAHPFLAHPFLAHPFLAHGLRANPFLAHGMSANPFLAHPFLAHGAPLNSAVPAPNRTLPQLQPAGSGTDARVVVLDTGLATTSPNHRPPLLSGATGGDDKPDDALEDAEGNTHAKDGFLDPVAGHGTFIAGLFEQLAPGCTVSVPRVISSRGDADEHTVADAIRGAAAQVPSPHIISLSLGGMVLHDPDDLRSAIGEARAAGIVVIASAGNAGTCVPHYPAAFEEVVAVAALGPYGPAPWTNYGDWVEACAPGTDLVSAFFTGFDGKFEAQNTFDADRFDGWAIWSGTSFAAPVVAAVVARAMMVDGGTPDEVVDRIVRAPHLARLPCLGTVVNP